MYHFCVNGHCVLDFSTIVFDADRETVLAVLYELGFEREPLDIGEIARDVIGAPFRLGASIAEAPKIFDCSLLTKWVYSQIGVWIPRRAIQQSTYGIPINLDEIRPGDLVFKDRENGYYLTDESERVGHVGIVVTSGSVVHAVNHDIGVEEMDLFEFVSEDFRGARRIADLEQSVLFKVPDKYTIEVTDDLRWLVYTHL